MRWTEALQGVRMAMFLNILDRWESAELNQEEAAELLGIDVRTFRRWTRRYEEEGEAGLLDRRLGMRLASAFRSIGRKRLRSFIASATRASPSSTSTSIW
jgi:DNA-binding Lrp family transcriptional regulator